MRKRRLAEAFMERWRGSEACQRRAATNLESQLHDCGLSEYALFLGRLVCLRNRWEASSVNAEVRDARCCLEVEDEDVEAEEADVESSQPGIHNKRARSKPNHHCEARTPQETQASTGHELPAHPSASPALSMTL